MSFFLQNKMKGCIHCSTLNKKSPVTWPILIPERKFEFLWDPCEICDHFSYTERWEVEKNQTTNAFFSLIKIYHQVFIDVKKTISPNRLGLDIRTDPSTLLPEVIKSCPHFSIWSTMYLQLRVPFTSLDFNLPRENCVLSKT